MSKIMFNLEPSVAQAGDASEHKAVPESETGTDGKVSMPASGQSSPKLHSDGVSNAATQGLTSGGQSAGGAYPNPHTGKEERGESGGFDGGQSGKEYHGAGQLGEEKADPSKAGRVGQGG